MISKNIITVRITNSYDFHTETISFLPETKTKHNIKVHVSHIDKTPEEQTSQLIREKPLSHKD